MHYVQRVEDARKGKDEWGAYLSRGKGGAMVRISRMFDTSCNGRPTSFFRNGFMDVIGQGCVGVDG